MRDAGHTASLAIDPVPRGRVFVAIGLDARGTGVLTRHGRVVPLVLGLGISPDAWSDIDGVVVGVGVNPNSPANRLSAPANSGQLLTISYQLRQAGRHGVERIVVERVEPYEAHTGALRGVADVYVGLSKDGFLEHEAADPSSAAADLIEHYASSERSRS